MKILKYLIYSFLLLNTLMISSCKDYLDVSDDLAAELTLEEVFNNASYSKRFHRNIYTGIPNPSHIILDNSYAGLTGLDNPWPALSDELKCAQGNTKNVAVIGYTAANAEFTRWSLYKQIRQANIFMNNAHTCGSQETGDYITEIELEKTKKTKLASYVHTTIIYCLNFMVLYLS